MTLHIFNPDHDLALASDLANFTAPHAARMLRAALGCLPAAWAREGDCVLVEDAAYARKAYRRLTLRGLPKAEGVEFVEEGQLLHLPIRKIEPWGWNAPLCNWLIRHGVSRQLLPSLPELDAVRCLSGRPTAVGLLRRLRQLPATVGEMRVCRTEGELEQCLAEWGRAVLKAPWSSSGRGVRFVERLEGQHLTGWVAHTLQRQGLMMAEPCYNKVKDFGMEFASDGRGSVAYLGLSLFSTANGAYTGNVLATEQSKQEMITRYLPASLLESVKASIKECLSPLLNGKYAGPLGIDMMVVGGEGASGFLLHPCVEINLRRTMGHVALALSPTDDDIRRVMRIDTADPWMLRLRPLEP